MQLNKGYKSRILWVVVIYLRMYKVVSIKLCSSAGVPTVSSRPFILLTHQATAEISTDVIRALVCSPLPMMTIQMVLLMVSSFRIKCASLPLAVSASLSSRSMNNVML